MTANGVLPRPYGPPLPETYGLRGRGKATAGTATAGKAAVTDMPARIDRTGDTIRRAVEAVRQAAPATVSPTSAAAAAAGGAGSRSIQDEDGNLYAMVDISTVNGPDVIAP